ASARPSAAITNDAGETQSSAWKRSASTATTSIVSRTVAPSAHTASSSRTSWPRSVTLGAAPQRALAGRVELGEAAGELGQRDITVGLHQRVDLDLRADPHVLLAVHGGHIDVLLALTPARHEALAVQPRHHREDRRVRARAVGIVRQRLRD